MTKNELLQNVSLFSRLGPAEIEVVAAHSSYYPYRAGEVVFQEGSVHDELYIIHDGQVVISKQSGEGRSVDVARYVSGECFGELGMLDSKPRTATATAVEESRLLVFPERTTPFRELVQRYPVVFAQILHKLLALIAGRIRTTNALISEKSPWVEALRLQLLTDELTGLYNRTFLEEDLARLLPEYRHPTSLLMVKPDNFKAINDTYGHEAGDGVLRLLAGILTSHLEEGEIAARYRGNEMAVILPGRGEEEALVRANALKEAIGRLDISGIIGGDRLPVTASIGIVVYPRDADSAEAMVECGFSTMWAAREAGGNRVSVATGACRED